MEFYSLSSLLTERQVFTQEKERLAGHGLPSSPELSL